MATANFSRIGKNPLNTSKSDSVRQAVRGFTSSPAAGENSKSDPQKGSAEPQSEGSALLDLVRSEVELKGPQKQPSAEVARLAFHLERIAAELANTRESLANAKGALQAAEKTEQYLQKYVDRFEEKSGGQIRNLESKLEEMTRQFHVANLQIAELKNALEITKLKNSHLEEKLRNQLTVPKGFLQRVFKTHAEA